MVNCSPTVGNKLRTGVTYPVKDEKCDKIKNVQIEHDLSSWVETAIHCVRRFPE